MILRRYVLRSLIGPFWLGFGIITFLLTMDMLLDLLDLLISKGIHPWTVTRLFVLALGWMVALSIPCGVLVSSLMTYGRLSQDNEIIALRASGVHLLQVILPALGSAVIVAGALTLFNNYVLPEANFAFASLRLEISRQRPTAEIREGVLIDDFRGFDLWIGRLEDRTGAMEEVLILDARTNPDYPRTILAHAGTLEYRPERGTLTLRLRDGELHEVDPQSNRGEYRRLRFESQVLNITDPADRARGGTHQRSQREMSIAMMEAEVGKLRLQQARQDSLLGEALQGAGLASLGELDRLDPREATPSLGALFLALPARLLGRQAQAPPPPAMDAEQQRWYELAQARRRELQQVSRRIAEYRVEIQKKYSIPAACIVFVLVGAPLGMLARRGGLAAGFFSAVFFVFYYLCLIGGEQLADRLLVTPWLAMWLPNVILGLLGVWLTIQAVVSGQPARPQRRKVA